MEQGSREWSSYSKSRGEASKDVTQTTSLAPGRHFRRNEHNVHAAVVAASLRGGCCCIAIARHCASHPGHLRQARFGRHRCDSVDNWGGSQPLERHHRHCRSRRGSRRRRRRGESTAPGHTHLLNRRRHGAHSLQCNWHPPADRARAPIEQMQGMQLAQIRGIVQMEQGKEQFMRKKLRSAGLACN